MDMDRVVAAHLWGGCAWTTGVIAQRTTESFEGRCHPSDTRLRSVSLIDSEEPADEKRSVVVSEVPLVGYSWQSLHMADAIEVLPLLRQLAAAEVAKANKVEGAEIRELRLRQQVFEPHLFGRS